MQILIILYLSILFGLQGGFSACGEGEGRFVFEGSMVRRGANVRGAGQHGVAADIIKEKEKLNKLRELPIKDGRGNRRKGLYKPSLEAQLKTREIFARRASAR